MKVNGWKREISGYRTFKNNSFDLLIYKQIKTSLIKH